MPKMTHDQFKALREQLGYTQNGLAAKLGVSQRDISDYETGHRPIKPCVAMAVKYLRAKETVKLFRKEHTFGITQITDSAGNSYYGHVHKCGKIIKTSNSFPTRAGAALWLEEQRAELLPKATALPSD